MSDVWTGEVDWETITAHFSPPLELQQPPPRRVLLRNGEEAGCRSRIERGCLGGCLGTLLLLGLLLLFWGGLAALILPLGTTTTGVVTQRERGSGRNSTYTLHFRFEVKNRRYESQGQVPTQKWQRTKVGDSVRVRYFPFAPGLRPLLADDFSPWSSILGLGFLGLLMIGLGGLPLLGLLSGRLGKSLVQRGIVTPAFITECNTEKNQLSALIRTPQGHVVEIKERLQDLSTVGAGQVEPALYLKASPQNARLYRSLPWKAELPHQPNS